MSASSQAPAYLLGHSDGEIRRLDAQADLVDPITRRLFHDAGIRPGMRVLDVGCGAGAVARLAADLVGPDGHVTSVEANPEMLAVARGRLAGRPVSFVQGDLADPALDDELPGPFDAVVGRFILFFVKDPAAVVRRLAAQLVPGGVMALHEGAHSPPVAFPRSADLDRMWYWIELSFRRAGLDQHVGLRLHSLLSGAGLLQPRLHSDQLAGGGPDWPGYELMAGLVHTLMPHLVKYGIATPEEVGLDTLADRLRAHTVNNDGLMTSWSYMTAWAYKPI